MSRMGQGNDDAVSMARTPRFISAHTVAKSFNRRRAFPDAFKLIRQVVLSTLDLSADWQAAIDSVPVVKIHLVPDSTGDWAAHRAEFGKVASKKITIFGDKLHLLVSPGGRILGSSWPRPVLGVISVAEGLF